MPTLELSPEQLDAERQAETLHEVVEQGGLEPLADNPFRASEAKAKHLTPEQIEKITLAHDYRDAQKLQFLINRDDLTTKLASTVSAKGVQDIIEERFDPKYKLQLFDESTTERVEPKEIGHFAEDAIVDILNESSLKVRAELGSDYIDHFGKSDIVLFIPTAEGDVCIKIQAKTIARKEEFENLPGNALLVELKDIPFVKADGTRRTYTSSDVVELADVGNRGDKRNFASKYLSIALSALRNSPRNVYPEAKAALGIR